MEDPLVPEGMAPVSVGGVLAPDGSPVLLLVEHLQAAAARTGQVDSADQVTRWLGGFS